MLTNLIRFVAVELRAACAWRPPACSPGVQMRDDCATAALADLLEALFTPDELLTWLKRWARPVSNALPGVTTPPAVLFPKAAHALERFGYVGPELMERLIEARPRRAPEIRAWATSSPIPPPPTAPTPARPASPPSAHAPRTPPGGPCR